MNTTKVKTHLMRAAFSFGLLCLAIGVIPLALGQRHSSKNSKKSVAPAGVICPTQWQLVANMPLDLYGAAGASDGTFSYHAGGYSFSFPGTMNVFNKYDPVANTWTPLAPMPQSALMATAVYYPTTNKIYVFGGEDGDSGVNYNLTQIYDIATNTWSAGAPMPDVRSFAAGGYNSANGKIYLATGYNTGFVDSAQPSTWEYDPVANTWTDLTGTAPFPHPVGGAASGVINGHLYVAGGRDAANTIVNNTFDYDIAANTWTQRADMSGADQNNVPGSAVALNKLWVFGGGNPFTGAGATKGASPSTKAAFAKALVKGVKGQSIPATANTTRFYNPPPDDTWSSFSSNLNSVRSFPSGAAIVDKLVCAGGLDGSFTVVSAETLDTCLPVPVISLSAHGRRVQGNHTVDLVWSGAGSANIDIYRDGVVIATVPNTGSYKDFIGVRGGNVRYTYKVCEAGTTNCSNEVIVRFGAPPL